ncbi:T6SS phospholipase effector Tle1-like catalytic domain-containing protein [Rhodotorula paludigena]|uniref:T6SS phospholipase effector Tle1-like catalytic domain-containing protein n=1 Tax=Rhodotorula paludigena TaxID=86838 RepID=UPI00316DFF8C
MKRLIVLCDGSLEDADRQKDEAMLTNIGRMSRAFVSLDTRSIPPVEQIKLYESGVGTDGTPFNGAITSALGRGMMQKVQGLYDFICLNWDEGDEIYLFGYSRGAYIVRLLAYLIDIIGILPPRQYLHLFPAIFEALDAHTGKDNKDDLKAIDEIKGLLKPLENLRAEQRKDRNGFLIQCVGVFDTVGARGRPTILRRGSYSSLRSLFSSNSSVHSGTTSTTDSLDPGPPPPEPNHGLNSFGLPESLVPSCVELAFQALALDEHRVDYKPVLWRRWEEGDESGRKRAEERERDGQVVHQVWFSGAHADVGGGYKENDLSFLSLGWMLSQVSRDLAFDKPYLDRLMRKTTAPWGMMEPHESMVDEFRLLGSIDRALPLRFDPCTNETFHSSILAQPSTHLRTDLRALVRDHRMQLHFLPLEPLEAQLKAEWAQPILAKKKLERTISAPAAVPSVQVLQRQPNPVTRQTNETGPPDTSSSDDALRTSSPPPTLEPRAGRPEHSPVQITRASSVTSFTDNEGPRSPPPSPSDTASVAPAADNSPTPSPAALHTDLEDDADPFPALARRQHKDGGMLSRLRKWTARKRRESGERRGHSSHYG